jgi:CRP-like cAMP-binding protein
MASIDHVALRSSIAVDSANSRAVGLIKRFGRIRVFEPGQVLFEQGGACEGVYVIVSGMVGLRRSDEDGNSALLSLVGSGEVVGYRALMACDLHSNTAEVLTKCRVHFVEKSQFKRLLEQSPAVGEYILQKALADLNRIQARCATLLTESLSNRFIKLLLSIREICSLHQCDECYEIELPIQRKDIAALLGVAPGSLSRLLSDLEQANLIKVDGRWIEFSGAVRTIAHGPAGAFKCMPPNAELLATLMEARTALLSMLDARDTATRAALNAKVQQASKRLDEALSDLCGRDVKEIAKFRSIWEQFKATRQTEIIPAILTGKVDKARQVATGIQAERISVMKAILSSDACSGRL